MMIKCCKCGKYVVNDAGVICVTKETRKHKRGRIAWKRDCVCSDCLKKVGEKEK